MLGGLTIITGLDAGKTVAEIVQFNNLKISTVRNVKQHYDNFMLPGKLSFDRKMHRGGAMLVRPASLPGCRTSSTRTPVGP